MIEHIVLLQPREPVEPFAVAALWSALAKLQQTIHGILSIDMGENLSPEGLGQGYSLGFVVRFTDAAARDAYLPHPEHLAVVPLVQAVAEHVLVFDLEASR
jgi:hypothetical protein